MQALVFVARSSAAPLLEAAYSKDKPYHYEENYNDKAYARHAPYRTSKRGTPRQPAYGEALALCQATALRHFAEPGSEGLEASAEAPSRAKAPALLSLGPCLPRQNGPASDASLLVS